MIVSDSLRYPRIYVSTCTKFAVYVVVRQDARPCCVADDDHTRWWPSRTFDHEVSLRLTATPVTPSAARTANNWLAERGHPTGQIMGPQETQTC